MKPAIAVPAAAVTGQTWSNRTARWIDRASIYLPLVLMALLAVASYWLLRLTPAPPEAKAPAPLTSEPDHLLRGFTMRTYSADGRLQSEIQGSEARHRPDSGAMEVDQARLRVLGEDPLTWARADRMSSNADKTRFVLDGGVEVQRAGGIAPSGAALAPMRFTGRSLVIERQPDRLWSDQPVSMWRGQDHIEADAMDYRQAESASVVFSGRVKARLVAQKPSR